MEYQKIRGQLVWMLFGVFLSVLTGVSSAFAENPQMLIEMINADLAITSGDREKSTLHIYRARQYAKLKEFDRALDDYSSALELNHKGWIHLERSQFLLKMKKYELAYEDANAAKDEVPTLAAEADVVIEKSVAAIRKKYEAENPDTIIMNTKVNPYRKTRFDVMREQGVFIAKNERIASSNSRRTIKRKQQSSKFSCAPKARS